MTILLIPLLVRTQHWPIHTAGQIIAAQALGAGIVVVTTMTPQHPPRPGIVAPLGILLAGRATLTLSLAHTPAFLPVISLVTGIGTGTHQRPPRGAVGAESLDPEVARVAAS